MSETGVDPERGFRCGMVAVVGRPNVGKSTLVNRILGHKVSIVSSRPQTTRHRILGIKTTATGQFVYVDTPGIHERRARALNRQLNRAAAGALGGVDLCLVVIEALRWGEGDRRVLGVAGDSGVPMLLVVNKVDLVRDKKRLLPFLAEVHAKAAFVETVPVSARKGTSVERLEGLVEQRMPCAQALFPEDQWTDCSERFLAAELLREKLLRRIGDELPHRLTVEIEAFEEHPQGVDISALVWVERRGQKAIVIGREGHVLKEAGTEARREIERLLGCHVRLATWVKVREGWSDDERALRSLGLSD